LVAPSFTYNGVAGSNVLWDRLREVLRGPYPSRWLLGDLASYAS